MSEIKIRQIGTYDDRHPEMKRSAIELTNTTTGETTGISYPKTYNDIIDSLKSVTYCTKMQGAVNQLRAYLPDSRIEYRDDIELS